MPKYLVSNLCQRFPCLGFELHIGLPQYLSAYVCVCVCMCACIYVHIYDVNNIHVNLLASAEAATYKMDSKHMLRILKCHIKICKNKKKISMICKKFWALSRKYFSRLCEKAPKVGAGLIISATFFKRPILRMNQTV
jgi:hypothetical protein